MISYKHIGPDWNDRHFQMHLLQENSGILIEISLNQSCSWGFNWHLVIIGSGNGLVHNSYKSHYLHQWWSNSLTYISITRLQWVNSGCVTHMCESNGPSLVQTRACPLFGTKALSEPVLAYHQLESWEQTSLKSISKYNNFHWRKLAWKYNLQNGNHCRLNEFNSPHMVSPYLIWFHYTLIHQEVITVPVGIKYVPLV